MVSVCDAIMGSGKSSACIDYMNRHPEKKYIYITPYLDEAKRIKKGCPNLRFYEPSQASAETHHSKTCDTLAKIKEGRNIASTHGAFGYYTPDMIEVIRQSHYTLMIDESVNLLTSVKMDPGNIEVLVEGGYVAMDNGAYSITDKECPGTFCKEFMRQLKSKMIYHVDGNEYKSDYYFWALSIEFLLAFDDVIIMTYLFHGDDMCSMMKISGIEFNYIGVEHDETGYHFCDSVFNAPEYTADLINKIHIFENKKLNAIGNNRHDLSMRWFSSVENRKKMQRGIRQYFEYYMKDFGYGECLYGTYKDMIAPLGRYGYKSCGLVFNSRATNEYANKHVLAYAANIFYDGGRKKFFKERGIEVNEDLYALSTMVQWIWRSAIRKGEEIWIYIPSRRMRELLKRWLNDLATKWQQHIPLEEREVVVDS